MDESRGPVIVRYHLGRVLTRWRLVAALVLLGAVLAGVWSMAVARTTWTATTALSTQSQQRAPEQDAVLALGYVNYFNQSTYQQLLRSETKVSPTVTLSAEMAATSPILYIVASGPTEEMVRAAATAAASTFREDVRRSLLAERQAAAGDLQAQVDKNTALLGKPGYNTSVVLDQIRSLQGRVTDIQADNTNQLKQLQPEPGVSSSSPSPVVDTVTGAAGGALLGAVVAFLLGFLDKKVRTPADLAVRAGLHRVTQLRRRSEEAERARQIRSAINAMSLVGEAGPIVVAVVAPRRTASAGALARELGVAAASARPAGALLVHADLASGDARARSIGMTGGGLTGVLDGTAKVRGALRHERSGLSVLAAGDPGGRAPASVVEPSRMVQAVTGFQAVAGFVVLVAPPLLDASESQVVCAVADQVLLVIDRGVTAVEDVVEARTLLSDVRAPLFGVLLEHSGGGDAAGPADPAHDPSDPTTAFPSVAGRPGPGPSACRGAQAPPVPGMRAADRK